MTNDFKLAAQIRTIVGYLAEQHAGWVGSQFFGLRSSAFLAPIFARTAFLAQCNGVTSAMARLHEDAIGVGRTYHLFRLPEVWEHGIADTLQVAQVASEVGAQLTSAETALAGLEALSTPAEAIEGSQVASGSLLEHPIAVIQSMGGVYLDAFRKGIKSFPFVREE